ncbi:hypothetical protein Q8W71_07295 [Methylobacterium sp. NEAU 140]|uniref:hypothetical protein n=1 Tax=Methylobacterium sp. NEAU 140 TaxID=3064945 RepID=UPI002735B365|nr:hypothetical protein [Methylobacterium sp. NEAU 140]MDP4022422.1 hypothetical protein [Methylobacterium sp. NEAU 140]
MMAKNNIRHIDPNVSALFDRMDILKEGMTMIYEMLDELPRRFEDPQVRSEAAEMAAVIAQELTGKVRVVMERRQDLISKRDAREAVHKAGDGNSA